MTMIMTAGACPKNTIMVFAETRVIAKALMRISVAEQHAMMIVRKYDLLKKTKMDNAAVRNMETRMMIQGAIQGAIQGTIPGAIPGAIQGVTQGGIRGVIQGCFQ